MKRFGALKIAAALSFAVVGAGPALAQSTPTLFTTYYRYDANRQLVGTISSDPDGAGPIALAVIRNTYDANGRLVQVDTGEIAGYQTDSVAPSAWTGFTIFQTQTLNYDAVGQKIKETVQASGVITAATQYSYDNMGHQTCAARRMNPANFGSLPVDACTLGAQGTGINAFGPDRITKNSYDAAGRLIQVQRAFGTSLQQSYETYTYDANDKQISVMDANGNLAQLDYDGFDRLQKWSFPSKTTAGSVSSTDYEQYGYDASGNRTSFRKRDGSTITFAYDPLDRVIQKRVPDPTGGPAATASANCYTLSSDTNDVCYGYDLQGHQLYARFGSASGQGITGAYDALGRQVSSTTNMGGVSRALSYQYDADGNRIRMTFPDANYFTYVYDGLDRPTAIQQSGVSTVVTETWDAHGRRSLEKRGAVQATYGYDPVSRLASLSDDLAGTAQDVTFCMGTMSGAACSPAYNPAGQAVSRTATNDAYAWTGAVNVSRAYTPNGLNQYGTIAGAAQSYDADGNMTFGGGVTYGYDIENRLISASNGVSVNYDPLGRLFQTSGGSAGTTQFVYDGDALVAEYNGSNTLLRRYIHGNDEDDPMLWYEGTGLTDMRSLQVDEQGSVVSVVNGTGTDLSINSYDEYGIPGSANAGRFQYTGQAWIPELGLYYYKARVYAPTLGRFLQTDPIGYSDQINLYAYVANDPINRSDPSGQNWLSNILDNVAKLFANLYDIPNLKPMPHSAANDNEIVVTGRSRATKPYSRPSYATTRTQKLDVQGRPCVVCGGTSEVMRAGHKKTLVQEYHETGTIDKKRMLSPDATQPECETCSARQGAAMSRYSRVMNRTIGTSEAAATEGEAAEAAVGAEQGLEQMEDALDGDPQ